MLLCFLKQITDHGKFFAGTWNRETDTESFFLYPGSGCIAIGTLVSQYLCSYADISQWCVWTFHEHHLDYTTMVQMSIETGVPFWVQGSFLLYQLRTSSWYFGRKRDIVLIWPEHFRTPLSYLMASYRQFKKIEHDKSAFYYYRIIFWHKAKLEIHFLP